MSKLVSKVKKDLEIKWLGIDGFLVLLFNNRIYILWYID